MRQPRVASSDGATHVYSAILEGRSVFSQPQDEQAHVVLLPSPQAEAETPLAAFQLHHKAALQHHRKEPQSVSGELDGNRIWGHFIKVLLEHCHNGWDKKS